MPAIAALDARAAVHPCASTHAIGIRTFADQADHGKEDAMARPRGRALAHALGAEQLEAFARRGCLKLDGVFAPEEVEAWRRACAEVEARTDHVDAGNLRYRIGPDASGCPVIQSLAQVVDLHPAFAALALDRRILDPLASIYAGREPRLFKDKLIMRTGAEPGMLHQDRQWWQGFPESLISVLVAIDAADAGNGATEVHPGATSELLTPPGRWGGLADRASGFGPAERLDTRAGDLVLFTCFVPHRPRREHRAPRPPPALPHLQRLRRRRALPGAPRALPALHDDVDGEGGRGKGVFSLNKQPFYVLRSVFFVS